MTHLCPHCNQPEDDYDDCPNYCTLKLAVDIARAELYHSKYKYNLTKYDFDRKNLERRA